MKDNQITYNRIKDIQINQDDIDKIINEGKVLTTQPINNPGGLSTIPITINNSFVNGVYRLRLTNINNQQSVTTNIIFQK